MKNYNDFMVTCLVLAAGLSQRFGSPKALAKLGKKQVLVHVLETLTQSSVAEIIVVLGAHKEKIETVIFNHKKIKIVYNKDYNLGQTSSVQAGLRSVPKKSLGVMVLPVDFPLIRKETFNQLIEKFNRSFPSLLIPTYDGVKGHPPIFHTRLKEDILSLGPLEGLNTLVRKNERESVLFPVKDRGVLLTFNTPEELKTIQKQSPADS